MSVDTVTGGTLPDLPWLPPESRRDAILRVMQNGKVWTQRRLCEATSYSLSGISGDLIEMVSEGKIELGTTIDENNQRVKAYRLNP